jgi:NAD(P)-dependent dehydrogenase (short-subunit alcohol dehydrogenase family)
MRPVAAVRFDFSDQVVLVTGGTKGVGRVIASRFAEAGAAVIVCARSTGRGDVEPLPDAWTFLAADLRDPEQAWSMVDAAVAVHGRLDVVVNNAGGSPPADTSTAPPRFTERIVALNLLAPMYVSQRANHHMQVASGGSIINIGSVTANRPSPTSAAYGAAKAGLANYTMTVGHEWAPKVRVNAITAGPILTELAMQHYGDAEQFARVQRTVPMGRLAAPDDVANTCLYLASPAASFVTGANVLLHGGGDRPAFLDALDG